ncbi:MAG TPA: hypothetical protein DIW31_00425 [Bacteroidales bacterium]|nr:hypothetical protein [Bacteroidales bacterium]
MRKTYVIVVLLVIVGQNLLAQSTNKEYTAIRTITPPRIDGVLNESVWLDVMPADGFMQNTPDEGKPVSQKTEVKIVYDDYAIYVGAMMYDDYPDSILHELGVRDASIRADLFRICFDTYNNQQDAYIFGVYASGVQIDSKALDPTYNTVWESKVQITDKGWCVEMRIPYSAIRFPSTKEQVWGFQTTRSIERRQEFAQWSLVPKGVNSSLTYWGKLNGISNINAPLRLSLTPFITTYFEESPNIVDGKLANYNHSFSYNFGADLKYGINEKFTLDLTLLPDFSQVQSDNKVKNLSYQEVTYSENRPFFKEGVELFNKNSLFYSRRIGKTPSGFYDVSDQLNEGEKIKENPSSAKMLNAIKISGRDNNGLGIGIFNAITENTYATIEDSVGNRRRILTEPLTNYNVVVFDQQMKNSSSFYLMNTNMIKDKSSNVANVTGSGLTLENKNHSYAMDANVALSQKYTKNDTLPNTFTTLTGYRYLFGARKISGNFQFGASHTFINKTYDSRDMGYYVIGNKMRNNFYIDYNTYQPNRFFRDSYNELYLNYSTNPETGKPIESKMGISLYADFLNYAAISIVGEFNPTKSYDYNEPRSEGRYFRKIRFYYMNVGFASDSRKALRFNIHTDFADFLEEYEGKYYGISTTLRYRYNDKLSFRYDFRYSKDNFNFGYVDAISEDSIIFGGRRLVTFENKFSLQFIFKNDMSLILSARHYMNSAKYLQFFNLEKDGEVTPSNNYNTNNNYCSNYFNIDLVYSWQFAPGSFLSFNYKNAVETESDIFNDNPSTNFRRTLKSPQSNSLSLKFIYYLDYQYVKKFLK